ncbi:MAG: hypothetical protein KatS3mg051_2128 [Anaerolineae bacterium]|nr:MAG: hypothetical protein KatS3mg051_2128 [Anaerolineae bacterium]
MAHTFYTVRGRKAVPIDSLPEEAWTVINGANADHGDVVEHYEAVAFLYRCVQMRANALVAVPWYISRGDDTVWSSEEDEPPDELAWLNDLSELLWLTEAALCLMAAAYWSHDSNRAGTRRMLGWYAPHTVKPVWDQAQGLVGFERRLGNRTFSLAPEEVVYIRLPNPLHETKPGRAPAAAALAAAGVLYNVDKFAQVFFERGTIKPTLLTVKGDPPERERQRLRSWWRRVISGAKNAFASEVVSADAVQPVVIGDGLESLSNNNLTTERREDIATAMGVPHSLVLSNAANYATAQQDELNFYKQTIIPECLLIARQVNRQLLAPLGYRLQFDWQAMSLFQEDEEARAQALLNYVNAGMPLHVAAEVLGISLPYGMEYVDLPGGSPNPAPASLPAREASPADAPTVQDARLEEMRRFRRWARKRLPGVDVDEFASDLLTRADKLAVLASLDGSTKPILQLDPDDDEAEREEREAIEGRMTRNIERGLREQWRRIQASGLGNLDRESVARWMEEDLERALARQPTEAELYDALQRALAESADLGVSVAVQQLGNAGGLAFDWTLVHVAARDWAAEYTGRLIDGINATTRERVRQAVTTWVENGEPLPRLIDDLTPIFGRQRAELIATTEVTRAYAEGNRLAYREAGVTQWQWTTARDERVCPVCGPLHGRVVSIGTDFRGGLPDEVLSMVPQSFTAPPAHPRCRCFLRPWLPEV